MRLASQTVRGKAMTIISEASVKEFAKKYAAAYAVGDDVLANHWLVQWAITKRVWFANLEHLLTAPQFHCDACADA